MLLVTGAPGRTSPYRIGGRLTAAGRPSLEPQRASVTFPVLSFYLCSFDIPIIYNTALRKNQARDSIKTGKNATRQQGTAVRQGKPNRRRTCGTAPQPRGQILTGYIIAIYKNLKV